MIQRFFGSAAVAALCLAIGTPAYADVIELTDGSFLPKSDAEDFEMQPGDVPSFEMLKETRNQKAELGYDTVKLGRAEVSAAQVKNIWSSEAAMTNAVTEGLKHARSNNFVRAAAAFEAAVEEMDTDSGKLEALFNAMLARQQEGTDAGAMLEAADALIAQDPKGYFMPAAQMLRARIFAAQGKTAEAKAALDAITKATGMNPRDLFEAELTRADWYTLRAAGKDKAKLAAAEKAYRDLARRASTQAHAEVQALKARVGAGKALVYQGKFTEARKDFEAVTDKNDVTDQRLLAAAYNGLGDAIYGQAKLDDAASSGDAAAKKKVFDDLTTAALHYLRVTELYGDDYAPDEVLSATQNLARVFANQFAMLSKAEEGDELQKRCKLGERAYAYYRSAWQRMVRGEAKRQLANEAKDFKKQLDAACDKKKQ